MMERLDYNTSSDKGNGYAPFARVIDKESSVEILMNDEAGSVLLSY